MATGQIIVFPEYSRNRYFDASTPEAILRAKYTILKDRAAERWYQHPNAPQYDEDQQRMFEMTEEEVQNLPAAFRKIAESARKSKKKYDAAYAIENQWWDNLETVINQPIDEAIKITYMEQVFESEPGEEYNGRYEEVNMVEWLIDERRENEKENFYFIEPERP